MTTVLFAVLAFALVASVLALGREMRLRKSLEKLLHVLMSRWRAHVSRTETPDPVDRPDPDKRL